MWPRAIELMLGVWLFFSPFIFRIGKDKTFFWANALTCGLMIAAIALAGFWRRASRIRFANTAISLWLIGSGWVQGQPRPPLAQNFIMLGLLLLMFSIIPGDAELPPEPWRKRVQKKDFLPS